MGRFQQVKQTINLFSPDFIFRDSIYRFSRGGETLYEGKVESLKRVNDFVNEAPTNTEVGIAVGDKKIKFKEDDQVEAFKEVTRPRHVQWHPPGF